VACVRAHVNAAEGPELSKRFSIDHHLSISSVNTVGASVGIAACFPPHGAAVAA
jgi:hypothetical protein